MACLADLWKQQVIDQKIYDQKLMDDTMRKLAWKGLQKKYCDTMIDKRTGEVLGPEVHSTIFKPIFIAFIDHKIACRRVGEIHILNGIDTLGTWKICDFS